MSKSLINVGPTEPVIYLGPKGRNKHITNGSLFGCIVKYSHCSSYLPALKIPNFAEKCTLGSLEPRQNPERRAWVRGYTLGHWALHPAYSKHCSTSMKRILHSKLAETL